jgi:hypothetical protein
MPELRSWKKPGYSPGMNSTAPTRDLPAALVWTGRVMSGLLAAFLAFSAGIKLLHRPEVGETLTGLGWPATAGVPIGLLEASCVTLYLIPRTAVLGAVLMTGLLGAAMATHIRVGSPLYSHVLFGLYMGLFAWGGLWLRDAKLRALMPWRRDA